MPTINYEHVDPTTRCSMGREFQMFQMRLDPLKVCDRCDKPIRERKLPVVSATEVKSANITGKVSENPLLNAAYLYGPGGKAPLPGPGIHPTPQTNTPQTLPTPPSNNPPGPLTG
jgi:hypothetical protein